MKFENGPNGFEVRALEDKSFENSANYSNLVQLDPDSFKPILIDSNKQLRNS